MRLFRFQWARIRFFLFFTKGFQQFLFGFVVVLLNKNGCVVEARASFKCRFVCTWLVMLLALDRILYFFLSIFSLSFSLCVGGVTASNKFDNSTPTTWSKMFSLMLDVIVNSICCMWRSGLFSFVEKKNLDCACASRTQNALWPLDKVSMWLVIIILHKWKHFYCCWRWRSYRA